jgi:GWxTD domain-containing protein
MSKVKFLLLASLIALVSCYSSKQGRDRERSYNKPYHREDNELKLNMFMLHGTNNTSFVYYKIDNSQLLYKKTDTNNYFSALLKVSYKFLPYPEAKQVLDSGTVFIEDKSTQQPATKYLVGYIPFRVNDGQNSYLELRVWDVFGKKTHTHYIECDKRNAFSQQSFMIQSINKEILFSNKVGIGSTVSITNNRVGFVNARVDYFANDYSLPPPPFSQKEPLLYPSIPDSSFTIPSADNHSFNLKIGTRGIYYIRLDSVNSSGCMIMGVEQNFPKVQSHTQMIAASRFIMNKEEYQKLIDAADKQAAIESFWLGIAGNGDRAKELIKRYYNRVQDANTFFSSHMEGWKTDMGMIYIIYGTPAKTYKTNNMETWEYYIQNSPPLTFRFEKITNPFSENCYKLQRSPMYKDPWTIAVSYWREGRVYLED